MTEEERKLRNRNYQKAYEERHPDRVSSKRDGLTFSGTAAWKDAMGIDWMTGEELAQAIPPAYTEMIGRAIVAKLGQLP